MDPYWISLALASRALELRSDRCINRKAGIGWVMCVDGDIPAAARKLSTYIQVNKMDVC